MMGDYEPPSYCPGTFKACTVAGVAEVADGYPDLALFVGAKARGVALLSSRLLVLDPGAIRPYFSQKLDEVMGSRARLLEKGMEASEKNTTTLLVAKGRLAASARKSCACGQCRERRHGQARVRKTPDWVGGCVKPIRACCGVRASLCCGAPPQGLCKAPHDSGICWKQFMIRWDDAWLWGHFILPPCTTQGRRSSNVQIGSACAGFPVCYLVSSVVALEKRAPSGSRYGSELQQEPSPRPQPALL